MIVIVVYHLKLKEYQITNGKRRLNKTTEMLPRYWLTPPELYQSLHKEFNFDFDPCEYPKSHDALTCEWGKMNYVNPPFRSKDGSPTKIVRRGIEESKKGNASFFTLLTQSYVNLLLEAGAQLRSLGRVKWLEVETKEPMKGPSPITGFYLPAQQSIQNDKP